MKRTLPGHVRFLIHQQSQFLCGAVCNPISGQTVFVPGIFLILTQNLALGLVELPQECTGPSLKPVKVSLAGELSLQCVIANLLTVLSIPLPIIANQDVRQCQSQHRPARKNTLHIVIIHNKELQNILDQINYQ